MRFVMTGHKGLIGSFLLKRLIELGHEPVLLVDKRDGKNILDIENFELEKPVDLMITLAGKGEKKFYPVEIAQPQEVEADISEIRKLGYEPKIDIEEGIKKTFEWYERNFFD